MATDIRRGRLLSRREFLGRSAGLGFAVCVGPRGYALLDVADEAPAGEWIGAWVHIGTDDRVTIITPAAEMGQGSMTGVPVALAEELDADWSRVVLEMAPAEPSIYGYARGGGSRSMAIVGSRAVRNYFGMMRQAGAQVRKLLLKSAAEEWGADPATLVTEPGVVVDPASGRRLRYGEIAAFAEVPDTLPAVSAGELKQPADFRLIGKSLPRRDIPEKVDGSAQFSIDIDLPGMLYSTTLHAPVQGSRPARWNAARVGSLPGVVGVVALPYGVAVAADSFEHALAARTALEVEWQPGAPSAGFDSEAALEQGYSRLAGATDGSVKQLHSAGDVEAAFAGAGKVFGAEYLSDYAYHAQMEPLNAVARFNETMDRVEIWNGSQAPGSARAQVAGALGFKVDQVVHHQMYLGGGFGRRSVSDYAVEAALVAREVRRPVKLIWTREEDLKYAMFRPQVLQRVDAALDGDGRLAGWRHRVVGDGESLTYSGINLGEYYAVPDQLIEYRGEAHGIRLKHWRAVAHPFNLFAIESMIDEMAADQGLDPFEFRRQRMTLTPRARAVFDAVERLSGWREPRSEGRALGLSVSERSGSLAAGVVEASLERRSGRIRVHRVWMAVDGGTVVQPQMARRNIESGIVYGLSSVLKERASVRDGAVVQSNFHDYELLRMSEAPDEIHIEFVESDAPPTGLGEIGNPFISAAVANAFFALSGKRLYHMPFTPGRVLRALDS